MKGILTRMMPVMAHPIPADEEEYTGEYSFAAEYQGPPVTYELPRAVPVDIKRIPTASMVAIASYSGKFALPVVQPLNLKTECSKELVCEKNCGGGGEGSDCRVLSEISSSSTLGFSNSCDRSCELSDVIDSSGVLGSSNGLECSRELSSGLSSSDMLGIDDRSGVLGIDDRSGGLGFSNGIECSNELSSRISSSDTLGMINGEDESGEIGRLDVLGFSQGSKESGEYVNGRSHRDWGSSESVLSSHLLNSEAEDFGNASQRLAKRAAVVTFRDAKSGDVIDEESSQVESDTILERKEATAKGKKGACYRCFKGNRFTEKEVCIVCTAKYCGNCVLRAMGSMPEGRKCVTCIGYPIDESKRGSLGKCSRVLKRLLSELEVQQIMKAEKFCEANQLQPEHVYVNGNQLSQEELDVLQSCPNPPPKLKPGCYWYDKVAGFWGKEGQKPCKIISPHLNVGGPIMPNASNGNTGVFINNREITKVELRMLQLAGVQCAGNPHFWVNEDGSYQEEGQKNIKGNLWSKAGTKLACALLSLPIPSKAAHPSGEEVYDLGGRALPDYIEKRTIQKLLLVGYKGCGTSTMFKQAKILYKADPFSDDEREDIKLVIQSNVYRYLGILLEGRERFDDESLTNMGKRQLLDQSGTVGEGDGKTIYSISPKLKAFSDWLLKVMVSGNLEAIFPAATREYAPLVEELWRDDAIQATFNRRSELQLLPGNASYFLERVVDISRVDYEPSNTDILYAEGITSSNGLSCLDFSFPQSTVDGVIDPAEHESLLRYQLIRVHARGLGENCKWLEMFEDVRIVIFCVALSDYDEFCDDGSGVTTNTMLESRRLFENIITHPIFEHMDFHLILNKFDLFEKKIERIPLNQCEWFEDFNPVTSRQNPKKSMNNASSAQLAFHYIAVKFKRHFSSLTGRKLYVSSVNGLEPSTVDEALRYSREILKWDEERAYFSASEYSIYSTEASFSP